MLSIFALFIASHIVSGISSSYNMLMLSRIGVACSHAIFWSIVTPLGVKVAPEGKKSAALSMIVAGSSFAMIIGLLIGRTIGLAAGWRATFLIIAAVALAVMGFLAIFLTRTPSDSSFSLRKLPSLIKTPSLLGIYLLTMIMITGHYTGYSYIEPFLAGTVGMGDGGIVCDGPGVSYIGYAGGVFASAAAAYCLFKLIPILSNRRS